MFRQEHPPGRMGLSDFTEVADLGVTIAGQHRYEAFRAHYGMTPMRNNPGVSHENGSVESAHGHLKRALADALLLRVSISAEI